MKKSERNTHTSNAMPIKNIGVIALLNAFTAIHSHSLIVSNTTINFNKWVYRMFLYICCNEIHIIHCVWMIFNRNHIFAGPVRVTFVIFKRETRFWWLAITLIRTVDWLLSLLFAVFVNAKSSKTPHSTNTTHIHSKIFPNKRSLVWGVYIEYWQYSFGTQYNASETCVAYVILFLECHMFTLSSSGI